MKYITADETSIHSRIEPLTAMVISVIVFGTSRFLAISWCFRYACICNMAFFRWRKSI